MVFVSLGLMWIGYAVAYDGWFQLHGATGGFLSYIAPGRDKTEKGFMFESPCAGSGKGTSKSAPAVKNPTGGGLAPSPLIPVVA